MRTPLAARDPFRIGVAALAAGGVLALVVLLLSVVSFGTHTYTAELEHSAGLRPGEDVQVHGVSVGEVTDVDLEGELVLVTFELDGDIELGSQSTAAVKVATLLGTHYLQVEPEGSGSLDGDRIPVARTAVPYNLQDVLDQGTDRLEDLDPVMLARALAAASDTLDASSEEIGPALEGVGRLSALVVRRTDQTTDLLAAARRVSEQLADDSDDIVGLMEQTNLVVSEVTARRAAIHRLLVETTGLADALDALVSRTDADLGNTLDNLDRALDTLNAQDRSLRRALTVMAPAMRYIANTVGNGPFVDLYVDPPALPADDQRCRSGGSGCS